MAKVYYAWSDIYNGGKVREVRPGRNVVVDRNWAERGSKVTQKGLGLSNEEWDNLVENGSIRDYSVPKGIRDDESPHSFVLRELSEGGELPADLLLKMSAQGSAVGAQPLPEENEEASELAEA